MTFRPGQPDHRLARSAPCDLLVLAGDRVDALTLGPVVRLLQGLPGLRVETIAFGPEPEAARDALETLGVSPSLLVAGPGDAVLTAQQDRALRHDAADLLGRHLRPRALLAADALAARDDERPAAARLALVSSGTRELGGLGASTAAELVLAADENEAETLAAEGLERGRIAVTGSSFTAAVRQAAARLPPADSAGRDRGPKVTVLLEPGRRPEAEALAGELARCLAAGRIAESCWPRLDGRGGGHVDPGSGGQPLDCLGWLALLRASDLLVVDSGRGAHARAAAALGTATLVLPSGGRGLEQWLRNGLAAAERRGRPAADPGEELTPRRVARRLRDWLGARAAA